MPDPSTPDPEEAGKTLGQSAESLSGSQRLSLPEDAQQDPSAPKISGYILVRSLGEGAFAQVWKAWQNRTRKWVALKVFTQRRGVNWIFLQREMERLIRLDRHPNVVSLLDADLAGDPAYYAMDLQEGGSLDRFPGKGERAPAQKAAQWMEEAAEALAFVHGKGLIHCDVKPANLLFDEEGRLRVADFGQSRIITESAGALGTLHYMAPEQAMTEQECVDFRPDVRWDVFALGAAFHAVLSGRVPHGNKRAEIEGTTSLRDRLAAYRKIVAGEPLEDLRRLTIPAVDEDLAAIVAGCVEADPEKRYSSMGDVLADLKARRECRPVSRLAQSRVYRLRRYFRRNTAAVALGVALVFVLAVAALSLFHTLGATRLELANSYILRARSAAEKGDDASAAVLYAKSNQMVSWVFSGLARKSALAHIQILGRPRRVWDLGGAVSAVAVSPNGALVLAGGKGSVRLLDVASGAVKAELSKISDYSPGDLPVYQAEFNRDGARAFVAIGHHFYLVDGATGAKIADLEGYRAAFSPDGTLLAGANPNRIVTLGDWYGHEVTEVSHTRGDVKIWDSRAGKLVAAVSANRKHSPDAPWFDWSPDGKMLLTCLKETIEFWDSRTGKSAGKPIQYDSETKMHISFLDYGELPAERAGFSPDGSKVLSYTLARAVLFDRRTGAAMGKVMRHDGNVTAAAFAKSGSSVLTAGEDGTLRRWTARQVRDAQGGEPAGMVLRHGAAVSVLALSPDGKLAATGGQDGIARLWSVDPWGPFGPAMVHASPVTALSFSGDGKILVTGSRDGTVRVWDVPSSPVGRAYVQLIPSENFIDPIASRMVSYDIFEGAQLRELPSGKLIAGALVGALPPKTTGFQTVAYDRSGSRVVTVARYLNSAVVWDAKTGKRLDASIQPETPAPPPGKYVDESFVRVALLSPDGRFLFTYRSTGTIALKEVGKDSPESVRDFKNFLTYAAFAPDGARLAASSPGSPGKTGIWSIPFGLDVLMEIPHGGGAVDWSPDGSRLATLDDDHHSVRLWKVEKATAAPLGSGYAHEDRVTHLMFSPDGSRLLSTSYDGTARLTDARTGYPVGDVARHGGQIWAAAFSPDGSAFATGGMDGMIRFWDSRTAEPLGRALWQGRLVHDLAFAPDGKSLYAIGNWSIQRWDVSWLSTPVSQKDLLDLAETLAQKKLDRAGHFASTPISEWKKKITPP